MSGPQTVAEVLEEAAKLIEPEGAWIGGDDPSREVALDEQGGLVDPNDPSACRFCLYGCIEAVAPNLAVEVAARPLLQEALGTRAIACWNHRSGRTQAEVVAKLREAAALAREQGL